MTQKKKILNASLKKAKRLVQQLEELRTLEDSQPGRPRTKVSVMCEETGTWHPTMVDAAAFYGIVPSAVHHSVRTGKAVKKKSLTFKVDPPPTTSKVGL